MVLAIVFIIMVLLPAIVLWIQQDTQISVRDQKSALAFNLAEIGIDRGMWKLKSSTHTFSQASLGTVIPGYNFDTVYTDVEGGGYRIKFSSGPTAREVTISSEGKDARSQETRAIRATFKNQTIPGAVIAGGAVQWRNAFSAHWGPVLAQGSINISDANAAQDYFPRKFSRQVVQSTIGSHPRDTNGLNLPNTDNQEWWSDYPVSELPVLDFATMRASAAASGTLNVFGCSHTKPKSWDNVSNWNHPCNGTKCPGINDYSCHFQNSWNHPLARKGYVWYWDESYSNVYFTGGTSVRGHGIWGTTIVRGNLKNWAGDNYSYAGPVPAKAWEEYAKITKTTGDTASINQYPADDGYQKTRPLFNFGGETWSGGPPNSSNTDVGFRGLLYVGGNFYIEGPADVHGAVWVVGDVSKATGSERTIIFYDDSLDVPSLNVILVRTSWNEIVAAQSTW